MNRFCSIRDINVVIVGVKVCPQLCHNNHRLWNMFTTSIYASQNFAFGITAFLSLALPHGRLESLQVMNC
jgi:hypothetical protein